MNLATFLAQVVPAATPTVTAAGSTAPDPGAFPGWAGVLFIIIGGLAAYGIYSWKAVKTALLPPNAADSGFRDRIARYVLNGSIWGLIVLASFIVLMPALSGSGKIDASAMQVFNSLLPVFGTWVGTLLAYYFSKENFDAATKSNLSFMQNSGAATGKLATLAAKDFMIPLEKVVTLPPDLQGKADRDILLSRIIDHLKANKHDRLPLFVDNKGSGPAKCVIQLDRIKNYIADTALDAEPGQGLGKLNLSDLLTVELPALSADVLANPLATSVLAPELKGSFSLVKQSSTLADAKAAMDAMTSAQASPAVVITSSSPPLAVRASRYLVGSPMTSSMKTPASSPPGGHSRAFLPDRDQRCRRKPEERGSGIKTCLNLHFTASTIHPLPRIQS